MGNSLGLACFSSQQNTRRRINEGGDGDAFAAQSPRPPLAAAAAANLIARSRNHQSRSKKEKQKEEEEANFIKQQAAAAAALLFEHHKKNGSLAQFNRSISLNLNHSSNSKSNSSNNKYPRASSSRIPKPSDSLPFLNQGIEIEGVESKRFVLVHGAGFGAWCWYKTITLANEAGYEVDAIDLMGSGANSCNINNITSFAKYAKPLTDYLQNLPDGNKVILVGHDIGGACISYAMELYPSKVSKAIYIAAAMLASGQSILDMVIQQSGLNDITQSAQIFLYENGKTNPPTAIDFDRTLIRDTLFNHAPTKDVVLASISMRPIPFAPLSEKLSLSSANYGSIPRFYVKTQEDFVIAVPLQEAMINANPPQQVFQLKGSDHCPFFSRPQALHRILVEISKIPGQRIIKTVQVP